MLSIILDSNMLLVPEQLGIDLFRELERICKEENQLLMPSSAVEELKKLSKGKSSNSRAARVALKLLPRLTICKTEAKGDRSLLELAAESKPSAIATRDKQLKKEAIKQGYEVIYVRSRSHLERTKG